MLILMNLNKKSVKKLRKDIKILLTIPCLADITLGKVRKKIRSLEKESVWEQKMGKVKLLYVLLKREIL